MKYLSYFDVADDVVAGQIWSAVAEVSDSHGRAASDDLAATVKDPGGMTVTPSPAAVSRLATGAYRVDVVTTGLAAGTYRVTVAGTDDALPFTMIVIAEVAVPDLDDVKAYLKESAAPWTDDELQGALDVETGRQRDACTIPVGYAAPLAEALRRRVARNLAMRALPLAYRTDAEGASVRMGRHDPVIKDIEDRYPPMVAG